MIAQYHQVIGTTHMPPYWALGWHQCRYGYPNLQYVEQVVANYSAANIPLDTIWTDIGERQCCVCVCVCVCIHWGYVR